MKVKVTLHAMERFRERIYSKGSYGFVKDLVRSALYKGYPMDRDQLTFGVVTFVLCKHHTQVVVITCWRADQPITPDQLTAERQQARSELQSIQELESGESKSTFSGRTSGQT